MTVLMDGKQISELIKNELKEKIAKIPSKIGLAVIHIGDDESSRIYIRQKEKMASEIGIHFHDIHISEETEEEKIIKKIKELNHISAIHGIIVQLPLPKKFNQKAILNAINKDKDVDSLRGDHLNYLNCTALGILEILKRYNVNLVHKKTVVIGKSEHLGKPIAELLKTKLAVVTVADSKTEDLTKLTSKAELVVVCVGKKQIITKEMIKEGAVIIDVGISKENGKIYGDVDQDSVFKKASLLTPVPGGVGPMTVVMLMMNTIKAYHRQNK